MFMGFKRILMRSNDHKIQSLRFGAFTKVLQAWGGE